jgi:SET domain-containing protein
MARKKRKPRKFDETAFEVKKSSIEGIGLGLFAKEKIHKGDTIGYYTGRILTDAQTERKPYVDSHYILWVCKDYNILGEGREANYTRYINHSDRPNARLVVSTRWKTARFEALKKIKPGEEIFFDYGPYFWENADFDKV